MKRIGMLYPSSGISEQEMYKMLPEGVTLHVTRMPMSMPSFEAEWHMADTVEDASKLLADAKVDLIAFNCTLASLIRGSGFDQEIIERIKQATGLPATTTTTAVQSALKTLRIQKFVLVSPYLAELHEREKTFFKGEGFQILNDRALGLSDCVQQYDMEPARWSQLAKELENRSADGYFVSCGGIRVVEVIEKMEAELKKPVVTSNQALMWHCLRKIGMEAPLRGFGRLLMTPL